MLLQGHALWNINNVKVAFLLFLLKCVALAFLAAQHTYIVCLDAMYIYMLFVRAIEILHHIQKSKTDVINS